MDWSDWLGLVFGILVAVWANKRGYAWWAYILASPIIGAIALGILPNLSEPGKDFENKEECEEAAQSFGYKSYAALLADTRNRFVEKVVI